MNQTITRFFELKPQEERLSEYLVAKLQDWCDKNQFNVNIDDTIVGTRYSEGSNCIYLDIYDMQNPPFSSWLKQFLYEYGLKEDHDTALEMFLHELGHRVTLDFFSEEEKDVDYQKKEELIQHYRWQYTYTSLEDYWLQDTEFAATIWSIMFMNNSEKMKPLEEIFSDWRQKKFEK